MPHRRLQDRIQALVAQAVATDDPRELEDVVRRLQEALREHANRLRQLAASKLAVGR